MKIIFNCPVGDNNKMHEWINTDCAYCAVDEARSEVERLKEYQSQLCTELTAHMVANVDLKAEVKRLKDGYAMVVDNLRYAQEKQQELQSKLSRYEEELKTERSLRPVWAKGYSSYSIAAQTSGIALKQVYDALGVSNMTQAIQKIKRYEGGVECEGSIVRGILTDISHAIVEVSNDDFHEGQRVWVLVMPLNEKGENE